MKVQATGPFDRDYARLSGELQGRVDKQVALLAESPGHPSLRIKKLSGLLDIWEARLTRGYRITFHIAGDTVILRRVGRHDILRNPE